jgi:tetratricopeptide (TPR) repeat protein
MKAFWFWPIVLTICLQLCFVFNAEAKMETITRTVWQPFGGSQSPDNARVAATAKAKRDALEQAGTYIESLTVLKDHVVEEDEILALAAGVLKAEVVSQENYVTGEAFGIEVVAKVDVDTSILEERVKKLLQDRALLEKYRESRQRQKELLAKVQRLEAENRRLQALSPEGQEQKKKELKEQFHNVTQALTAVEWHQKALALLRDGKLANPKEALEYLDQAIRLNPELADSYTNRGVAYKYLGQYERAIEAFNQAIRLNPELADAYYNRGIAYGVLGRYGNAANDYNKYLQIHGNKDRDADEVRRKIRQLGHEPRH